MNYRWDLKPGRNTVLRTELGRYVDSVGPVPKEHPAFAFSTEREDDDHTVDFAALQMFRDSTFDIFLKHAPNSDAPLEDLVEAFVDDTLYQEYKNELFKSDTESPKVYSKDAWQNAETVEESLDPDHNLRTRCTRDAGR